MHFRLLWKKPNVKMLLCVRTEKNTELKGHQPASYTGTVCLQ